MIGSYARNGFERTDSDGLRRRGYVVDTFRDAYGPELLIEESWPLEELLKYVAANDWRAVDEVRELWSRDPRVVSGATPASLAEAIQVRPLAAALKAGTLNADRLLELRQNRFSEGLLRDPELRRRAWEVVQKVWTLPQIRKEFADLLRKRVDELLADVRKRAKSVPAGAWREGWEALKQLAPVERRAEQFGTLMEALGASPAGAAFPPRNALTYWESGRSPHPRQRPCRLESTGCSAPRIWRVSADWRNRRISNPGSPGWPPASRCRARWTGNSVPAS